LPILPLPQFEADLAEHLKDESDRIAYEKLNAPKTLVVRYGYLKMVGEFPWQSKEKPGCGSKIVVRTHRGTEIGEMLTSTCANSGCSKSVSRKEMLEYIENSGGRQYPFSTEGRALRIATPADLNQQASLEQSKHAIRMEAKRRAEAMGLPMKIVEAEPILGGERMTIYFNSEDRVDFRDLVTGLQNHFSVRIDMRQVGARDEARITADYERCGQYCCCKNFLKVLKPISMKSAKVQKATLDPLKISGRCGRLMCCLRYEDETYEDLRKRLPHRKSRVGTPDGDGVVMDTQILTQLALVRLDTGTEIAVPVENLSEPKSAVAPEPSAAAPAPARPRERGPRPGPRAEGRPEARTDAPKERPRREPRREPTREPTADAPIDLDSLPGDTMPEAAGPEGSPARKKRRRRKRKPGSGEGGPAETQGGAPGEESPDAAPADGPTEESRPNPVAGEGGEGGDAPRKKRRRRRKKRPDGAGGQDGGPEAGGEPGDGPGGSDE
jgi:cell fate regulator YaaT (PSP1 superfamily)